MEDRIIARLRKSEIEEIVIALRTYQGNEFADFRIFFGARGQETRPTKKGSRSPSNYTANFVGP